jgi:hypothetical protein
VEDKTNQIPQKKKSSLKQKTHPLPDGFSFPAGFSQRNIKIQTLTTCETPMNNTPAIKESTLKIK